MEREAIIRDLEKTREYVNNPNLSISEDERRGLNERLDNSVKYARYGRYHVTALGVFSTGKSTLLNAMVGVKLLPTADLPTTAITTEIYSSDKTYFFIPIQHPSGTVIENVRKGIYEISPDETVQFATQISRDGSDFSGVGGIVSDNNVAIVSQIITELTSQQKRSQEPFGELKKLLDKDHDLPLWLGISTLPDWLKDIVLTDSPGTGSIDDSHEIIVNKVIPESQLVLYLIESAKAGSAIDKRFCDRISNTYHRKIFYILNKIDQQNNDERAEALDSVKRCAPDVAENGEAPDFLTVAGLYAHVANELKSGTMSLEHVLDDVKVNLNKLLIMPEWAHANTPDQQIKLLIQYLMDNSNYSELQSRIEEYLRFENKELAIVQHANSCIADVSSILTNKCTRALNVLNSDMHIDELSQKKDEAHESRKNYAHEAEIAIKDYLDSALDANTGLGATIKGLLSPVSDVIAEKLKDALQNNTHYKSLQKKEALNKWLNNEIRYQVEDVIRKLDTELNKRYRHLLQQLIPILKKIEDGSLGNSLNKLETKGSFDVVVSSAPPVIEGAIGGAALAGGGAYLLTLLGIGTTVTATGGTGLAGWLAGLGWSTLAGGVADLGLGTLTTTTLFFGLSATQFFIPIIGLGAVATTLLTLLVFGKDWKIQQILKKTKELLDIVVMNGGSLGDDNVESIASQMQSSIENTVNLSAAALNQKIKARLRQLDEEEDKLIQELAKAKEARQEKISALTAMKEEVMQCHETAERKLRTQH